jgi:AAA15 family ATPase/GTPase
VLIDEVETAVHKDVIRDFFSWIITSCREFDVQLFVTTHSLEAVDSFISVDMLQDVAGYRLERGNTGIEIQRFGGEMLHKLRYNRGLDPR